MKVITEGKGNKDYCGFIGTFRICLPMQETWVQSLGQEEPLEKSIITLQYSCLGNPMDGGTRLATVHGVTESDMT